MSKNLSPEQYAKYLIKTIKKQGCCYDLLPVFGGKGITIKYVVDGDRIGFYESENSFGIGLPKEFLAETFKSIKMLLANGMQESAFAKPYWENRKKKSNTKFSYTGEWV